MLNANRTKADRRRLAFKYKGNALVCEAMFWPLRFEAVHKANRVMEQFRCSNRARQQRRAS